jgi:two-component system sensor histidine kinase HupT/HoxJ
MSATQEQQEAKAPSLTSVLTRKHDQLANSSEERVWIDVIQQMDAIYTELVQYQVELEEKNTELEDAQLFIQSVISSMSDVLIVCDTNSAIIQVNTALEKVTDLNAIELKGRSVLVLFSDNQQAGIQNLLNQARTETITDIETDLIHKKKAEVPMAISCSPLHDHKNRFAGYVITGRPLGELHMAYSELHQAHQSLKNTQQRLIQSEKMASLGRLVAGVAHELNNPISFLYANMHALQSYEQKIQTYLAVIHGNCSPIQCQKIRSELNIDKIIGDLEPLVAGSLEGAERVSDIVKNLRQFSMPQEQHKTSFDLVQLIKRATSWVLNASWLKPKIITDYPEQLEVTNNEGHVHQILINLIQNAVDSLEESEERVPIIHLEIQKNECDIKIVIYDNGHGINPEDLVRIFDPFFTTKPVGHGTGLGLYISYGLAVEQCHGDLSVANREQGGAVFILTLPLEGGSD